MNYDFSQKRHWRRTMWNRVVERLTVAPRNAVVLYLSGAQDEDRAVALSKGFRGENLIAVDKDPRVVKQLRQRGVRAIDADIFGVAATWMPDRRIDVVMLDFCCGLTESVALAVPHMTMFPQMDDAVFVVNMLRGRDQWSNDIRAKWAPHVAEGKRKNRARVLTLDLLWTWAQAGAGRYGLNSAAEIVTVCREVQDDDFTEFSQKALVAARPFEHSYRSTAFQTFDSVVFKSPVKALGIGIAGHADALRAKFAGDAIRRKTAAVLAHRTRNLKELA